MELTIRQWMEIVVRQAHLLAEAACASDDKDRRVKQLVDALHDETGKRAETEERRKEAAAKAEDFKARLKSAEGKYEEKAKWLRSIREAAGAEGLAMDNVLKWVTQQAADAKALRNGQPQAELEETKRDLASMEKQLSRSKREVEEKNNMYHAVQRELDERAKQYGETQEALDKTKRGLAVTQDELREIKNELQETDDNYKDLLVWAMGVRKATRTEGLSREDALKDITDLAACAAKAKNVEEVSRKLESVTAEREEARVCRDKLSVKLSEQEADSAYLRELLKSVEGTRDALKSFRRQVMTKVRGYSEVAVATQLRGFIDEIEQIDGSIPVAPVVTPKKEEDK